MAQFHSNPPVPAGNSGGSSPFDQIMLLDHNGEERWSARDLQQLMGYERWERFDEVITRAQQTISASGLDPLDHFRGTAKVIPGGRWGKQQVADYRLTRRAGHPKRAKATVQELEAMRQTLAQWLGAA